MLHAGREPCPPPEPLFNRSVFWAQGISFGLGLRF